MLEGKIFPAHRFHNGYKLVTRILKINIKAVWLERDFCVSCASDAVRLCTMVKKNYHLYVPWYLHGIQEYQSMTKVGLLAHKTMVLFST